ncbi:hypothetical protein D9D53_03615 [Escherichia coli]|nr:hypothetical protein [Escherichia coli]EFE7970332.1 hypothetical protein [Escherichia coli]
MDCVHHIWCPLFSQEFQDLPDGAETTLTIMIPKTGLNVRSPNVVFGVLCALPHFGDYYLH